MALHERGAGQMGWRQWRRDQQRLLPQHRHLVQTVPRHGVEILARRRLEQANPVGVNRHHVELENEFCVAGRSRVLMACAKASPWWMTREILRENLPNLPTEGQRDPSDNANTLVDGYLSQCWVPTDLAVKWLGTHDIQLPDNLLPSAPTPASVPAAVPVLRKATDAKIHPTISAIYDHAKAQGMKPPNLNEIARHVLPRLRREGLTEKPKPVFKTLPAISATQAGGATRVQGLTAHFYLSRTQKCRNLAARVGARHFPRRRTAETLRMEMTDIERRAPKGGGALPDLAELPIRLSRDTAAKLLSRYFFEVSPRTLERWPVAWRHLNERAHAETAALFAHAEAMLAAAPPVMGGRKADRRTDGVNAKPPDTGGRHHRGDDCHAGRRRQRSFTNCRHPTATTVRSGHFALVVR